MLSLLKNQPPVTRNTLFSGLPWRRSEESEHASTLSNLNTSLNPSKTVLKQTSLPVVQNEMPAFLVEIWAPGAYLPQADKIALNTLCHRLLSEPSHETVLAFNRCKNALIGNSARSDKNTKHPIRIFIDLKETGILENLDLTGIDLNDCILRTLKKPGGFEEVSIQGTILKNAKLDSFNPIFIRNQDHADLTNATLPKEWLKPKAIKTDHPPVERASLSKKDLHYWFPPVVLDVQHQLKQHLGKLTSGLRSLSNR